MAELERIGILLLHGFAGARSELSPLPELLERRGFIVSVPVLPGHESTRKDLSRSKYSDWIRLAMDAAVELNGRCSELVVIGFSMGGLVAINIYRELEIKKLILINTPVYYWDISRIIKNLASNFKFYLNKYFTVSTTIPFRALAEFLKILRKTRPLFADIRCPALIIQTLDDDTVNHRSAGYIFRSVKGEKVLREYETGGHVLFGSEVASDVFLDIEAFLYIDDEQFASIAALAVLLRCLNGI